MHTSSNLIPRAISNSSAIQKRLALLIFLCFICGSDAQITSTVDTCAADTSTAATSSDGYLSNFVYYASFKRDLNSTLRFRNPYAGQSNITQAAVMLWIKLPSVSADGSSQRGRLFDCNSTFSARLDNKQIGYNLTQNYNFTNGTTNATLVRTQQFATMYASDPSIYLSWNHLAFSFSGRKMRIHINGVQVNETNLSYALTNTTRFADQCTVGNSINYTDPLSDSYIRHLVFLNVGSPINVTVMARMRYIYLPSDQLSSVLSYFSFSRVSEFNETYLYNMSRQIEAQNVSMGFESEPETVCFKPSITQQYLKLSPNNTLAPLNLSDMNLTLSNSNIIFQIWIFPLKYYFDSQPQSTTIFKFTNFTDIILVNGSYFSVNLYTQNSSGSFLNQTINFTSRRLSYHTWTLITIQLTNNQSVLYFDNQEIERRNHSTTLPSNFTGVQISSNIGSQLETLVFRMSLSYKQSSQASSNITSQINQIYNNYSSWTNFSADSFTYLFNYQTTADKLKNGSYFSNSQNIGYFQSTMATNSINLNSSATSLAFTFQANNQFAINQNDTTLQALWDLRSFVCQNLRQSPLFNYPSSLYLNSTSFNLSRIGGSNNTLSFQFQASDTYTIDFWFKIKVNLSQIVNSTLQSYLDTLNQSNSATSQGKIILVSQQIIDTNTKQTLRFLQNGDSSSNSQSNQTDQTYQATRNSFLDQVQTYGFNQTLSSAYEANTLATMQIQLNLAYSNQNWIYSLNCNPFARNLSNLASGPLKMQPLSLPEDNWQHFTCSVDNTPYKNSSDQSILANTLSVKGMTYNSQLKLEQRFQANRLLSNYQLINSSASQSAYIGSNNDGSDQFYGFMKEIRIFKTVQSLDVMSLVRNQKTPDTLSTSLSYYIGLTNGLNPVVDDKQRDPSKALTSLIQLNVQQNYEWTSDDTLIICNKQQYFNGKYCVPLNLTATINQLETTDLLILNSTLAKDVLLDNTSNFTWQLTSVMPNNTAYFSYLNQSLQAYRNGRSLSFNRSALFRNSSFILTLSISNIFSTSPQNQNYAVVLVCPLLNIDWPQNLLLHPWGYTPKLSLNAVISTDCYNQNAITARNIAWTYNFTNGDPATLSTPKTNLTFTNETRILNDTLYQVNLTVNFSNNQVLNSSRLVRYLSKPISFNLPQTSFYLPASSPLVINANSTQFLTNTVNQFQLGLQINCFTPLAFTNSSGCSFNSTGYFILNNTLLSSSNPILPYVDYFFNVSAGKPNSVLLVKQNVQARWFNPGYSSGNILSNSNFACPGVQVVAQVNVSKQNISSFIYYPTFYLDCLENDQVTYSKYNISSVSYQLDSTLLAQYQQQFNQSLGIKSFSEGFITQNSSMVFRINSAIISKIKAGDIIPINITMNATNSTSSKIFTDTKVLLVNVVYADIVIVQNSTANATGFSTFENQLVLNASQSFDPDMNISTTQANNSMLTYNYLCNAKPCTLNSTQMKGGVISMTILDVLNMNLSYLTPTTFQIGIQNSLILRKPIQYATFFITFLPPDKHGTVTCPRVYFIRQNSSFPNQTAVRQSNFTYSTYNVSSAEWRVAYENCDNFTSYTVMMMLIDLAYVELTDNNTSQIQSKTFNSTNITISQARLLANIRLLQTAVIRATLIFNYTNSTTKTAKLGYSTSDLAIKRDFSPLIPQNSPSGSQIGLPYEETLTVSAASSFDPDYSYALLNPKQTQSSMSSLTSIADFNIQALILTPYYQFFRTCSSNVGSGCLKYHYYQDFNLTKQDRIEFGIQSIGSSFWISLTLLASNRTSLVLNQTFVIVTQDYDKCISISDLRQNFSIQQQTYNMLRYLTPNYQLLCDFVGTSGGAVWSSPASKTFWTVNSLYGYDVALTPELLSTLDPNQTLQLSVQLYYYKTEDDHTQLLSKPFNYSIKILPTLANAIINLTEPLDLSQQNTSVNIYLNSSTIKDQAFLSSARCNISALIDAAYVTNFTNSEQCRFDIMSGLSAQYLYNQIATFKTIVLFANLTFSDGSTYQTKKALSIRVNSLAPQCYVTQESNFRFYIDKPLTVRAQAKDFDVGDLDFFWDDQSSFRYLMPENKELSRLTLDPFALVGVQGKNLVLESSIDSVGSNSASQNDCRASFLICLPSNDNIQLGNVSIQGNEQIFGQQILSLNFTNDYIDLNQGDLIFQLFYEADGKNQTLLTKQPIQNVSLIVPLTDLMFIEVIDWRGAVKLQSVDLSNLTINTSPNDIDLIKLRLQISAFNQLTYTDQPSISGKHLELMLNMYEQQSLLQNQVQSQIEKIMLITFSMEILSLSTELQAIAKTNLTLDCSNSYLQDAKLNAQYIQLKIYSNLYECVRLQNFSEESWTQNDTIGSRVSQMQAIPRSIYESMKANIDPSLLQLDGQLSTWMSDLWVGLVTSILSDVALTSSEQQELQMAYDTILGVQKSKLNPGQSLQIASQNLVIQKIDLADMPQVGFTSSNNNVSLSIARADLTSPNLFTSQAFLNIQLQDSSNYPFSNPNLTIVSSIVTINFTDASGQPIEFKDRVALIAFTSVDIQKYPNMKCSYWNETGGVWLYQSWDNNLTTQVVNSSKQVYCKTTHLSTFAVFNITELANETNSNGSNGRGSGKTKWENTPSSTRRIIISIVQIVFIMIAINAFIINTRNEFQKALIFREHSYANLQSRLTFRRLFLSYSKLLQLIVHDRAHFIVRVLLTLCYIFFVALLVLLNLVFLGQDRVVEDDVFLVFTIWLFISLLGPYLINITLYKFYQFVQMGSFSDILQRDSKVLGVQSQRQGVPGPKSSAQIIANGAHQKNEPIDNANNQNSAPFQNMIYDSAQEVKLGSIIGGNPLKKSQLTQQYQSQQLHTSANMILMRNAEEGAGPEDAEEEAKLSQLVSDEQDKGMQSTLQMSYSRENKKKYKTQKIGSGVPLESSTDHKPRHNAGEEERQSIEFENETDIDGAKRTFVNIQDSNRSHASLKSNQDEYAVASIDGSSGPGTPKGKLGLSISNVNQLQMSLNAHSLKKINDLNTFSNQDKRDSESDDVHDSDSDNEEEDTNQPYQGRSNNRFRESGYTHNNQSNSLALSQNAGFSLDPTQVTSQMPGNGTSQRNRLHSLQHPVWNAVALSNISQREEIASGREVAHNFVPQEDTYEYGAHADDYNFNNQNLPLEQDPYQEEEFLFEGGGVSEDDQIQSYSHTGQRMTSNINQGQQRNRQAKYEISEADPAHIHPNRLQQIHTIKDVEEKIIIKTNIIVIIYILSLLLLIAADVVLFYFSKIQQETIYNAFIADMCISIGVQILVLDLLVCLVASNLIKQTGLQKIGSVKGVVVFGFFNVSRLRSM